ncbi:pilus assembly PilX family protein [Halomonas salipaludis]|uniref:Type 4 fimbrial biogenesis protein PilX N-terminal domain-containing protein n=1 Tax=Halomonas salipaludis TaxID=2032625 RepID=A0A2A2EPX6_9GAMM|nr:PilX N-terminal domain-containing pilus assembly protein [Halomonas salipaludis]PAU74333.1 hypothetical protein CK498_22560 [Halomonas salipaludis]
MSKRSVDEADMTPRGAVMKHQKGAALIVVLSLLVVSLMLGLSSMQSSQIDERLAGNYKAQASAQMGAEGAVSLGLDSFRSLWGDEFSEKSVEEIAEELSPSSSFSYSDIFSNDTWHSYFGYSDSSLDCSEVDVCVYSIIYVDGDNDAGLREGVYIVGLAGGTGALSHPVLAQVSVGLVPLSDLDPLTVTSDLYDFEALSSGRFKMGREGDGNIGTSISVSRESDVSAVMSAIEGGPDKSGNYATNVDGEYVVYIEGGYPIFSSATALQELVDNVVDHYGNDADALAVLGTPDSPKISYVQPESGTYSYNESSAKSGILVVDGNFSWSGNNTYEGLIVVLGQTLAYNGGGGSIRGALVHASIAGSPGAREGDWSFGIGQASVTSNLNGGGDFSFVHSVEVLDTVARLLEPVSDGLIDISDMKKTDELKVMSWR